MFETLQLEEATQEAVLITRELGIPGDGIVVSETVPNALLAAHLDAAQNVLNSPIGMSEFDPEAMWCS